MKISQYDSKNFNIKTIKVKYCACFGFTDISNLADSHCTARKKSKIYFGVTNIIVIRYIVGRFEHNLYFPVQRFVLSTGEDLY